MRKKDIPEMVNKDFDDGVKQLGNDTLKEINSKNYGSLTTINFVYKDSKADTLAIKVL